MNVKDPGAALTARGVIDWIVVWRFNRTVNGWSFAQFPQQLLAGDLDAALGRELLTAVNCSIRDSSSSARARVYVGHGLSPISTAPGSCLSRRQFQH